MQDLEHTSYAWTHWRGRVVLFRRMQIYLLWYLLGGYGVLFATQLTVMSFVTLATQKFSPDNIGDVFWVPGAVALAAGWAYGFLRLAKTRYCLPVPKRSIRCGRGAQLGVSIHRIPQPTTMGGTLPSYPTRWLELCDQNGRTRRMIQVRGDPDLSEINRTLASNT